MNERTVKQQVGRIRHQTGSRDVATTWALTRGWSVKWSKSGPIVKPLV